VTAFSQPQENHQKIPRISNICDPVTSASIHYGQQPSPVTESKTEDSSSPEIVIAAGDCEVSIHENASDFLDIKFNNENSTLLFSSPNQETTKKTTKSFCRYCKKVFLYSESRNRHEREGE
jgi:hypothetical protein